jgi:hypothetical protein
MLCQPPNKQLERAVTPRQERAAGAPLHYAPTARWTAQRAVAQLRRYSQRMNAGRFLLLLGATWALAASTTAGAEPPTIIPTRGDPLSYVWLIDGVHTVATSYERVRAFEIAAPELDEVGVALEVTADNREPNSTKAGRRVIWKVAATFSRIDNIELDGYVVTIRGWNNRSGRIACSYEFSFVNRVLADELADRGCAPDNSPQGE